MQMTSSYHKLQEYIWIWMIFDSRVVEFYRLRLLHGNPCASVAW